ncbi:hypothetical protein L0F63_004665 [Massospora cicadina]|nr:hypothetical protein L0F63_004665 [Massospora cicadina]
MSIVDDGRPRRTWSLYTLSSASHQIQESGGGSRYPNFPEQRVRRARYTSSFDDEGRRRQSKLLLVSLLENFCLLYDESPHHNRHLFLVICKMLSSMGIVDEEYIDELSGVRQSYIRAFKDLVAQATAAVESKNLDDLLDLYDSRYRTDFEEKVMLELTPICKEQAQRDHMLREIKNLARLEHTNIVRYYSSWIEYVDYSTPSNRETIDPCGQSCYGSQSFRDQTLDLRKTAPLSCRTVFNEDSYNSTLPRGSMFYRPEASTTSSEAPSEASDDDQHPIQFSISNLDDSSCFTSPTQPDDLSSGLDIEFVDEVGGAGLAPSRSVSEVGSSEPAGPESAHRQLTLFIQMQLCGATLKDFLHWRNAGEFSPSAIDPNANIALFRAIVEGVKYIHHSGLIHRDLKPANIFLSLPQTARTLPKSMPVTPTPSPPKALIHPSSASLPIFGHDPELTSHLPFHDFDELVPKIGDFGLATSHSPELVYDHSDSCTLLPFATGMERAKVLKDLRRGVLPADFVTKWPKEAAFVLWLMADDPELRPSADEILQFELINPPATALSEMSAQLAQRDAQVKELLEENKLLKERIKALESCLTNPASPSPTKV